MGLGKEGRQGIKKMVISVHDSNDIRSLRKISCVEDPFTPFVIKGHNKGSSSSNNIDSEYLAYRLRIPTVLPQNRAKARPQAQEIVLQCS